MIQSAGAYTSRAHPVMQPRSLRSYRFALTPLADAMFQLLIFFMLTSSLTPYSLLTIRSGPLPESILPDPAAAQPDQPIIPTEVTQIWTIAADKITIKGNTFRMSDLAALAAAIGQVDQAQVILIMDATAQVQDLTSVLEALSDVGVTSLQIARLGDRS